MKNWEVCLQKVSRHIIMIENVEVDNNKKIMWTDRSSNLNKVQRGKKNFLRKVTGHTKRNKKSNLEVFKF